MGDLLSKGQSTKQIILDAAFVLFLEQGYHAASMRQIAQQAGLALGGIYNHFESKEQIFESILLTKHPYRRLLQILQEAPGDSFEQIAQNAARAMLADLDNHSDLLKLIFIELNEFNGHHLADLYQDITPRLDPLLIRFQDHRVELRALPMPVILLAYIGSFLSFFMMNRMVVPASPIDLTELTLDKFIDIFLYGVIIPGQIPFRGSDGTSETGQPECT